MNRRIITAFAMSCLVGLYCTGAFAQVDPDLVQAAAANQAARAAVQAGSAANVVPGYTTSPPETAYSGVANLKPAAQARLANCALAVGDPLCDAQTGAVASANTPKPAISPLDPSVAGAKAIVQNPFATFNGLAAYYSGCSSSGACGGTVFCLGVKCFDTTSTKDPDFAQAMTYLESAREAGIYLDPVQMRVFSGEQNNCRDRLLKNCCYTDGAGAGFSNQSIAGVGSRLVFDVLMNAGNRKFFYDGMKSLLTNAGFSGTFTSFGVTVAVNGAALPAGSVTLMSTQSMAIAFNPWSLGITAVMYIATSMMSCNDTEGKLAMKEGAKLCLSMGTWCSKCITILGKCISCIEHTTSKCCFNSLLARLINEQGRAQIGKGWGGVQNPDCTGFTVAELQSLDFAKMDLSLFYASIVPEMPNVGAIQNANAGKVGACYFGGGKC